MSFIFLFKPPPHLYIIIVRKGKTTKNLNPNPRPEGVTMKMSTLIQKTVDAKAAEAKAKIKDGYKTILNILENGLQGAEMLPGSILKLTVASVVGDEFAEAIKDIGNDVLKVQGKNIWRSTTSRGVITVEGIRPDHIDEDWEALIEMIKLRVEVL